LQRYPLATLKIDRRFIQHMLDKPCDAAIAKALIGLGCDMGLETIAEGIETSAQEVALRGLGCSIGQGYLYGRPMPFAAALEFIDKAHLPLSTMVG
jgi:EAL domain-containing protein (putative c-di-GMP-specific phosphodiesterase class I)